MKRAYYWKLAMDAIQQLFIVGTLGALFVFVPLHAHLSAGDTASQGFADGRYPVALESASGDGHAIAWLNPEWVKSQQKANLHDATGAR